MDITFHEGLNVITGENSSGKSTVVRFIAFAIGAENIAFNQIAQLCNDVYLEISANDAIVTLRRSVDKQILQPLSLFWGELEGAIGAAPSLWQQYPFKRSEHKESFSQILFRILEMPELRGDSGSNITMHQLMRLIYSDQETPHSDLFRFDRFDKAITRAAVGDYLLGIDSSELYELRLQESADEKEAASLRTSTKTIYSTFGRSGAKLSLEFIDNEIGTLGREIAELQQSLNTARSAPLSRGSSTKEDNALRSKLTSSHARLSVLKDRKFELEAEIADSELFLKELNDRILSLEESTAAQSYLGNAIFSFCPSCFSSLPEDGGDNLTCKLCKSKIHEDSAKSQLARMRNELALQRKESLQIRSNQLADLQSIIIDLPAVEKELKALEAEYRSSQSQWRSPHEIQLESIARQIGSKEQELKNSLELKKLADLLEALGKQLSEVEARLEFTRGRIEAVARQQQSRREHAYLSVADNLKMILKEDLLRQAEFANAEEIDIDFAANRLMIDRQRQFSASSMVFLRHGFHLALLLSSMEQAYFRYPRLLIIDGIEDGGMEVDRSYNFQRMIARHSQESNVTHQIIMTTANICPDLDSNKYIVGRKFTTARKSIDIIGHPGARDSTA
ncbi:ATP-binding protein [Burkholderia plantarii]|uniref:ATP-binding protein n=1 Tax=Burkholderia plantarii TaxID=41899 RepID=UPI0011DD5E1F|nr:ATP-binding protein [Burkholderia plantarii]